MNQVRKHLEAIFKSRFPKTAIGFFSSGDLAAFHMPKNKMTIRLMTKEQIEKLRALGLLGAEGWSLK